MLEQAKQELQAARCSLERMTAIEQAQPIDVDIYEGEWLNFLSTLERIWYKSNSELKAHPKRESVLGHWRALRTTDPLLSFLTKSRGAREHSHLRVTGRGPAIRGMSVPGEKLRTDERGIPQPPVLRVGQKGIKILYDPDTVQLKPIEYRGRVYEVPRSHFGSTLYSPNPTLFARLGIAAVEEMLRDVEAKCMSA